MKRRAGTLRGFDPRRLHKRVAATLDLVAVLADQDRIGRLNEGGEPVERRDVGCDPLGSPFGSHHASPRRIRSRNWGMCWRSATLGTSALRSGRGFISATTALRRLGRRPSLPYRACRTSTPSSASKVAAAHFFGATEVHEGVTKVEEFPDRGLESVGSLSEVERELQCSRRCGQPASRRWTGRAESACHRASHSAHQCKTRRLRSRPSPPASHHVPPWPSHHLSPASAARVRASSAAWRCATAISNQAIHTTTASTEPASDLRRLVRAYRPPRPARVR